MPPFGAQHFKSVRADELAPRLSGYRRILLLGEMGAGKSTLAVKLLRLLTGRTGHCRLLELDPGTPPFGIPGTVSLASWGGEGLSQQDYQALCTLDAGRFRLPLILATRRLVTLIEREQDIDTTLLIDAPGVVRGVGGAELLMALTESLEVDAVVVLHRENAPIPLARELAALPVAVLHLPVSQAARATTRLERLKDRTSLWDRFLAGGIEETVDLDQLPVLGTPPPREAPNAWTGRQAALLDATGGTLRMGEVLHLDKGELALRMVPGKTAVPVSILIRDAGRNPLGRLETVKRIDIQPTVRREPVEMTPPFISIKAGRTPVSSNLGRAWATLVGGAFGDPLVHVRFRYLKQSLLFDLGDPARLAARVAHQVSAIFLSHAHIDHVGGLTWFLRSRLGPFGPCRIFGPRETIRRIESLLDATTWDRIDDKGPVFEVYEIDETSLRHARLQPGQKRIDLPEIPITDGTILTEKSFSIKAVVCDHGIPSIAYALLFQLEIMVRKERLAAAKLSPGPWLGTLKQCIAADTPEAEITLPNGRTEKAGTLAKDLTILRPGRKLTYAADMADTPENRKKVTELARSSHTFFCEAPFIRADKDKADASQHLTTLAAVDIALAAGVERLVPFHFSKRYEHNSRLIYDEILKAAGPLQVLGHFR
jgi:ribonuclease BN (tRNA processing enzyme)